MIEIIIMVIAGIIIDVGLMMADCKLYHQQKESHMLKWINSLLSQLLLQRRYQINQHGQQKKILDL